MCVFYFMSFYFAYALSAILFSLPLSYFACVLCLSVKFAYILYLVFFACLLNAVVLPFLCPCGLPVQQGRATA